MRTCTFVTYIFVCVCVCVCVTTVILSDPMAVPPARTHSVCVSNRERGKEMDTVQLYPLYIHLYFTQVYTFMLHTTMPIHVAHNCTHVCFTHVYTFMHTTLHIYDLHYYTHSCFTQLYTFMFPTCIHVYVSHKYTHSCCTHLYTSMLHTATAHSDPNMHTECPPPHFSDRWGYGRGGGGYSLRGSVAHLVISQSSQKCS